MKTFKEWFAEMKEWKEWFPFSNKDLEKAYEAGWDACRDKWGGLEYKQSNEE